MDGSACIRPYILYILYILRRYVIDSGAARYYGFCTRPLHFPEDGACDTEAWDPKGTGVQMYPLATFIEEHGRKPLHVMPGKTPWYYDTIGIRPLATALAPAQQAAMAEAIKQYRDRPYQKDDDNPGEMMNAAIDCCECCWMKNAEEHRDTLFCSELVAAVYMDVGLLPPAKESGLPADEYMPSDFSRDHGCNASSLCCSCLFSWWCGRGCFSWGDIRNYSSSNPKGKKQQQLLFQPEIVLESPDAPASLLVAVAVSATDSASSKRASARKKGSAAAAPIHPS